MANTKPITPSSSHPAYTVTETMSANDTAIIRIDSGKFEGTQYFYGVVGFVEGVDDDGMAKLNFEVEVTKGFVDGEPTPNREVEAYEEFEQQVGDILVSTIVDFVEANEKKTDEDSK